MPPLMPDEDKNFGGSLVQILEKDDVTSHLVNNPYTIPFASAIKNSQISTFLNACVVGNRLWLPPINPSIEHFTCK